MYIIREFPKEISPEEENLYALLGNCKLDER